MRPLAPLVLFLGAALAAASPARAQTVISPPSAQVFKAGVVRAIAVQPDGKVIIGGEFSRVGSATRHNVARLHSDGMLDEAWNPGADGTVLAISLDAAGNAYIGGHFNRVGGQERSKIARLLPTGEVDAIWNPRADREVTHIAAGPEGVFVAGEFGQIGGGHRAKLAKLSTSGAGVLVPEWNAHPSWSIRSMALDPARGVYVAGAFTSIGGRDHKYLARLSTATGAADPLWAPQLDAEPGPVALDSNGYLYVGTSMLIRIPPHGAGASDRSWDIPRIIGLTHHDGYLYARRSLTRTAYDTIPEPIIRVALESGAYSDWGPAIDGPVHAIAASGSRVVFGGEFGTVGESTRASLGALAVNSAVAEAQWPGVFLPGTVMAIARDSRGRIIIAGSFIALGGGELRANIARLEPDLAVDKAWNPAADRTVRTVAVDTAGRVYAGGHFRRIGGEARKNLALLRADTGKADPTWKPVEYGDPLGFVSSIALGPGDQVYVAGNVGVGGARISANGEVDASWRPGRGPIAIVVPDGHGNTYVGGSFTTIGGQNRQYIAKLSHTGSADPAWDPGTACYSGSPPSVESIALDASGVLFAGGRSFCVSGHFGPAKYGPSGTPQGWTPGPTPTGFPFGIPAVNINALAIDPGAHVYVGGAFTTMGGLQRGNLARLSFSGTGAADPNWYADANGEVHALLLGESGELYVGGGFSTIAGEARSGFAILSPPPRLIAASPASIDFGLQSMGTTSLPVEVTILNDGEGPLSVDSVSVSDPRFRYTSDCPASLPRGASCRITVVVELELPRSRWLFESGAHSGMLTITGSGGAARRVITLGARAQNSLVHHYYFSILRRAPETDGWLYWNSEAQRVIRDLGANLNETWYAMAMAFYNSAEYLAHGRSATEYVRDLYRSFFSRGADDAGLGYWVGRIGDGMPREVALVEFMFSREFRGFTSQLFGNSTSRAEIDMLVDFYRGILGRLPDTDGFRTWLAQLRSAQCQGQEAIYSQVESISSGFVSSVEYMGRSRSTAQFVGDMYNTFLRRGGDLEGVKYWIRQIDSGARTRDEVRRQFISSPEFSARVASVVAQGCLR